MSRWAIGADRVFTGHGDEAAPGWVIVEDARIAALASELPAGMDGRWIEDATILPGLIDAHTHLSIVPCLGRQLDQLRKPAGEQLAAARALVQSDLSSGVTTMRVLGQELDVDFTLKEEIERGETRGPRLICSGVQIAREKNHGCALTGVQSREDIVALGEANIAKGAGVLKIFMTGGVASEGLIEASPFALAEVEAAAGVAHAHGVKLAAHALGGEGARLAIDGGVDTIEHGILLTPELIERAAARGCAIVGTLAIVFHPAGIERGDRHHAELMEKLARVRLQARETWRRILATDIRISVGTDSMHGCLAHEAAWLVEFGATPARALRAITTDAAEICQVASSRGALQAGFDADLLVVGGNPLEDTRALLQPLMVVQQGSVVHETAPPQVRRCRRME